MPATALTVPSSPVALRAALIGVRALVLDADGVLLFAGRPLPRVAESLSRLESAGVPYRVVTNFSSSHRTTLAANFSRAVGVPVDPERIITAASAAAAYTARHYAGVPLLVLAAPDARAEWDGQHLLTPDEADAVGAEVGAVVIGDAGDDLSFRNLNIAFRAIRAGAAFVAMHRNLWWVTPRGVTLDAGAFVVGLEESLGQRAIVAGKPSRVVFREAVRALAREAGTPRLAARDVAMVGDDLESDIGGAHRAGLRALLVLSGKTDAAAVRAADGAGRLRGAVFPDAIGEDLSAVVEALIAAR
ncbi:MAG: HAD-IIA family hydrolase [Chloroflexota bacterium]